MVVDVLTDVRAVVAGARFPLAVPSATAASDTSSRLTRQLDDYLLPRLRQPEAPLLAVVGGSTGAGKSTLVNSLVRAPASAAGVLRPTTRAPVLLSHPSDARWFTGRRVLPGLTRSHVNHADEPRLQVIGAPALTPGLALLDAPDIDSVVDQSRKLATRLLAAADLWLFVTTAARYADAVPWQMLRSARDRGTVVMVVLDRVPAGDSDEIAAHLREMLIDEHLAELELFIVPEAALDSAGLLPERLVAPLAARLTALASNVAARLDIGRTTLDGALRALRGDVDGLASAADEQTIAWHQLDDAVTTSYQDAEAEISAAIADGTMLRGDVRSRWQEFVGTDDLARLLRTRLGRLRDRTLTAATGRRSTGDELRDALAAGVAALIEAHAITAGERVARAWADMPAGAALVTQGLARPPSGLSDRCGQLVREWHRRVLHLVAHEGGATRRRITERTVRATGVLVMIAVCASTVYAPTDAELADAGGATAATHKLLDAVFGDDAMRQLSAAARQDLMVRVHELLDVEAARFGDARTSIKLDPTLGERLRRSSRSVAEHSTGSGASADGAAPEPDREPTDQSAPAEQSVATGQSVAADQSESAARYVPAKTHTPAPPGWAEPRTWRPVRRDMPPSHAVPAGGDQASGTPTTGRRP